MIDTEIKVTLILDVKADDTLIERVEAVLENGTVRDSFVEAGLGWRGFEVDRGSEALREAVEACAFDQYGSLYSMIDARKVVVAARALLGMPPMPEN